MAEEDQGSSSLSPTDASPVSNVPKLSISRGKVTGIIYSGGGDGILGGVGIVISCAGDGIGEGGLLFTCICEGGGMSSSSGSSSFISWVPGEGVRDIPLNVVDPQASKYAESAPSTCCDVHNDPPAGDGSVHFTFAPVDQDGIEMSTS